ncbi:MAG: hypothetical protein WBC83_00555 [Minisyncoccia bacterium]
MKSIKVLFNALQKKNVGHGAYISLVGAVKWRGYTRDTVSRNFTELMPKGDYVNGDRESLIDHLMEHTQDVGTEEHSLEGVKAPRKNAKKKVEELHKEELVELPVKKVKSNYYGEND